MLQKPNLGKIKLTSDVAKSRLIKVWEVIDCLKWMENEVKIIAKLNDEMGENKGNISAFLGGKRQMSTNFYNNFLKKYENKYEPTSKTNPTKRVSREHERIKQAGNEF